MVKIAQRAWCTPVTTLESDDAPVEGSPLEPLAVTNAAVLVSAIEARMSSCRREVMPLSNTVIVVGLMESVYPEGAGCS